MLISISVVEALVVHFLLSFWSPALALILTLLTIAGIIWMIALLRSFKRLPVLVGKDAVTMRVGTLRSLHIPAGQLGGLRLNVSGEDVRKPGVLNLALINHPNVLIDLDPPLASRRRPIRGVAHQLDDPAGFAAAVQALLAASRSN